MPVIDQATYLASVKSLQDHIRRGDCYEINFCQEFSTTIPDLDPVTTYIRLQEASPAPFAAFYKWNDNYVLCASPERYLRKSKDNIYSQPMKGTAKRNHEDAVLDALQKTNLQQDPKERAENIIVVDLVRNDLSKVAARGTVEVEELCGVYSFPQVHQMTSTIKAVVKSDTSWVEIIKATFPMGSMTGAPKKKVLELTTAYEPSARGIYSGSIGYVHPNGDFDFNVVIRSLVYNQTTGDLSYHVGSGITIHSVAEKEYEECLLKAAGILSAISNHHQLSTQESVE